MAKSEWVGKKSRRKSVVPGFVLLGGLFIGTICGLIWNNLAPGILIGLGSGFVMMAILRYILLRKPLDNNDNTPKDNL